MNKCTKKYVTKRDCHYLLLLANNTPKYKPKIQNVINRIENAKVLFEIGLIPFFLVWWLSPYSLQLLLCMIVNTLGRSLLIHVPVC